jgi:hypothetical protein
MMEKSMKKWELKQENRGVTWCNMLWTCFELQTPKGSLPAFSWLFVDTNWMLANNNGDLTDKNATKPPNPVIHINSSSNIGSSLTKWWNDAYWRPMMIHTLGYHLMPIPSPGSRQGKIMGTWKYVAKPALLDHEKPWFSPSLAWSGGLAGHEVGIDYPDPFLWLLTLPTSS